MDGIFLNELWINLILLLIPAFLFSLSLVSIFINRQNMLRFLVALEMMMLALNLFIIVLSFISQNFYLLIFVPFLLALAAVEAAIGLGLLTVAYKRKKTLNFEDFKSLKG
jgi:NADH-quinone oxidoreductase subunit K